MRFDLILAGLVAGLTFPVASSPSPRPPTAPPADKNRTVTQLKAALVKGTMRQQQAALVALGKTKDPMANTVLADWLDRLLAGTVAPELHLELLEAAARQKAKGVQARLQKYLAGRPAVARGPFNPAAFSETLAGGDAARGRDLFFKNQILQCARCHRVGNQGGDLGPALDAVGQQPRAHLLESIVNPNAKVTPGFETLVLVLKNGKRLAGIVKKKTGTALVLLSPEDGLVKVLKKKIRSRRKGLSSMPAGLHLAIPRRATRTTSR